MDQLDAWSFTSRGMDVEEDFYFPYRPQEIADYQNPAELVAALKQKQEEVILAAQLGNALLLENRQLKDQCGKLHEQYADKLEVGEFYYSCAAGFVWNEAFGWNMVVLKDLTACGDWSGILERVKGPTFNIQNPMSSSLIELLRNSL